VPRGPKADATSAFWARVREYKIIQWGVAYLGAALALAHGQELVGHAFHWPDLVGRIFMVALIAGLPIALTLAWYHGHRGLRGMSAGELTIISVLVLIGAVFFATALRPSSERTADAASQAASAPVSAATVPEGSPEVTTAPTGGITTAAQRGDVLPNSVAVLPCENRSPSESDAFFADGIHDEILLQLGKFRTLNPISQTSVARYAGSDLSIPEIAAELRVRTVMECSVRYAENRVRITAQLIDAATDQPLWSEVYERDFADVFAIQADIGMNIANALNAEFSPAEQQALEQVPTSSPAAYALYLEASTAMRTATPGGVATAHALLDRSIAIDPRFSRAYGLKALIYSVSLLNTTLGNAVAPEGRAELDRRVREYVAQAVAIDPADPQARAALRSSNVITWRWVDYRRALEPNDETELTNVGVWIFSWMGEHAEAVRIAERVAEINPNDTGSHLTLGVAYAYAGDHQASIRSLNRALELSPANPLARIWLAFNAIVLGKTADAVAGLDLIERLLGDNRSIVFLPELAYAYSRLGRADDARRVFDEIQALGREADLGVGTWPPAYLAIGDEEEALRWLDVAAEKARNHEPDQGQINLMNLRMNFLADPRLEEPRFAEVLSRIRGD
jgi:TolB-like protein/Flp pilus assembly protein TadD